MPYAELEEARGRGHLFTEDDGRFWFWSIKPVAYPIPEDGPVGERGCLLVRPDGFVAWRSVDVVNDAEAELGRVLDRVLGRAQGESTARDEKQFARA